MPIVLSSGSIRTPRDLLTLALRDSGVYGVGQTPLAEDINNAFKRCNMMLAQWAVKRWLIYQLVDTAVTATGAQSYTVGPAGDFDIARPDRLENGCYMVQANISPNPPSYPLELIESREDYSRITLKNLASFTRYVFYDPVFPVGMVYFLPIPSSPYEMHILTKAVLSQFTSLSQAINLPDVYLGAIFYNMLVRLRIAYGREPDAATNGLAKDALAVIRASNTQIPSLRMPRTLSGKRGYDIYGDNN